MMVEHKEHNEQTERIIGYSGLELFEDCYGYNENACYIADTEASADEFMKVAADGEEFRIEPVTLSRIMDDYGCSSGEYALETEAFKIFSDVATKAGIKYQISQVELGLTVVEVEGVKAYFE